MDSKDTNKIIAELKKLNKTLEKRVTNTTVNVTVPIEEIERIIEEKLQAIEPITFVQTINNLDENVAAEVYRRAKSILEEKNENAGMKPPSSNSEPEITTAQAVSELTKAIRLTVEYVGNKTLPAKEGWSWFDALSKYAPEQAQFFVNNPIYFPEPPEATLIHMAYFAPNTDPRPACWELVQVGGFAIANFFDMVTCPDCREHRSGRYPSIKTT